MITFNIQLLCRKSPNYYNLLPDLVPLLTLSGYNYPYLEQISMVPMMFKPLKFDYIVVMTILQKTAFGSKVWFKVVVTCVAIYSLVKKLSNNTLLSLVLIKSYFLCKSMYFYSRLLILIKTVNILLLLNI